MPELSVTVRVPWPKHPTLAALEKAIFSALMEAGRQLLLQALRELEERLLEAGAGARQRRRRRYLLTRFGELRFSRWQTRREGRYGYPLDEALGIPSKDPCSPWVRQAAAFLAQAHPFRQAARLLRMMIGCFVDHRRLWGWAQTSGGRVREEHERRRARLFGDGELPPGEGPGPGTRSTSADGTFIHSRDGPACGEARDVVDRGPGRAPRPPPPPGQGLLRHHRGRRSVRADLLRALRGGHGALEGAGGPLRGRRGGVARGPPLRLDLAHRLPARPRLREAQDPRGGEGPRAGREVVGLRRRAQPRRPRQEHPLWDRRGEDRARGGREPPRLPPPGSRRLPHLPPPAGGGPLPQMAPRGSGATRHAVDLVVARRFKRQGMRSWSREGADNLLALRTLAMDPEAWRAWWGDAAW